MFLVVLLCLGAALSPGATPPAVGESNVKAVVSQNQVDTWVGIWQKRLHLQDWKIEARIVRSTGLKPDTLGNLKWNSVTHTATIKVLNPIDYDMPAADVPEDIEYTVVHELVHLQLSVLPRDGSKEVEEVVVNKISDALMELEHGPTFRARSTPPPMPSPPELVRMAAAISQVAGFRLHRTDADQGGDAQCGRASTAVAPSPAWPDTDGGDRAPL